MCSSLGESGKSRTLEDFTASSGRDLDSDESDPTRSRGGANLLTPVFDQRAPPSAIVSQSKTRSRRPTAVLDGRKRRDLPGSHALPPDGDRVLTGLAHDVK